MKLYHKAMTIGFLLLLLAFLVWAAQTYMENKEKKSAVIIFDDTVKSGGIYLQRPPEVEALDVKPDILGWFDTWGKPMSRAKAETCMRLGITPLITWQPGEYKLVDIGNGVHDGMVRDYLTEIHEIFGNNTVLIRFAHEMECASPDKTTWYPWQYYGGEQDYIKMWKHVVDIGRRIAPNVRWIWSPNRINEVSAKWYPGDEYVDYISMTLNHKMDQKYHFTRFEDCYNGLGRAEEIKKYNKKVILSEVAYADDDKNIKGEYLKSIFDYVRKDDQICAVVFFNYDIDENRQYRFSDDPHYINIWYDGVRQLHEWNKENENTD